MEVRKRAAALPNLLARADAEASRSISIPAAVPSMSDLVRLARENARLLAQGRALLATLADELYAAPAPALGLSGAGSHLRHCVDFYARFFEGLAGSRIDYEGREREARLELDRAHALERLDALIGALEDFAGSAEERPLLVRGEHARSEWASSSLERELEFLASHTVHHYALIAVALRAHGRDPGREFGVAPSTLRYWKEREDPACAR